MKNTIDIADLNEMLGLCYNYQDMHFPKVQMDTEHAVEILQRLIKFEEEKLNISLNNT